MFEALEEIIKTQIYTKHLQYMSVLRDDGAGRGGAGGFIHQFLRGRQFTLF